MSNEMKKQLLLSLTIFMVVLGTLIFWYDNFVFHTYVEQIEYQECLQGQNDDFIVQGYEFYQHNQKSYFGNERLIALNDHLLMKDDTVKLTLVASVSTKQKYELTQTYRVKSQNEVCVFDQNDNNEHLDFSKFKEMALKIQVQRKNKAVYNQTMDLKKLKLTAYNGGNKNYTIQNVYASSQWLKTGIFSSTDNDLTKNYQRCVVDYMLLKADGDEDNIDDYERIVNISQSTKELIDNPKQTTYFYDGEGSLLDRQIRCVVTLMKDEQDQHPLVFVIDLHGTIKEGITDGKSKDRISLYMFRNMIATFFVAFVSMELSLMNFYHCDIAQCLQRLFFYDIYTLLYFVLLWLSDYLFFEISKILYDLYEEKITFIPCIVLVILSIAVYFLPLRDLFQYNISFLFVLIIVRMIKEMWKRTPELFVWLKKKRPESGLK